jgi:hypothetical protein
MDGSSLGLSAESFDTEQEAEAFAVSPKPVVTIEDEKKSVEVSSDIYSAE